MAYPPPIYDPGYPPQQYGHEQAGYPSSFQHGYPMPQGYNQQGAYIQQPAIINQPPVHVVEVENKSKTNKAAATGCLAGICACLTCCCMLDACADCF